MPDVDPKLATGVRQARNATKEASFWFAFVAKGTSDGAFLVGKKRIPKKEITEAKTACNGGQVFQGRCFGEDGQLICEMGKQPSGSLAKQVKTIIGRDAGVMLNVEFRVAADLEVEEEGSEESVPEAPPTPPAPSGEETPSAPPPPETDGAARFKERLKALLPDLQKVQAANHPLSEEVKLRASEVQVFARKKEYDQAHALLDRVESLIKQVLGAPPPPPPSPEADGAGRFKERLKVILPDLQKAQTANHPLSEEVKLRASDVQVFARKKEYDQAHALLDKVESLIKQVLGAPPPAPPLAADGSARLMARLQALMPDLQKARAANHPLSEEVKLRASEVQVFARKKEYDQAHALLDRVESLIKHVLGTPPPPEADGAARMMARLQAIKPDLQKVRTSNHPLNEEVKLRASEVQVFARKKEYDQAHAVLDKLETLIKQALAPVTSGAPQPSEDESPEQETEKTEEQPTGNGLEGWKAARAQVIGQLQELEAAIVKSLDPDANRAKIILGSVQRQLTESPTTPQQVAALEKYLKDDDVIAAAEEAPSQFAKVRIREPLLKALAGMKG